jgi:hypothetical protein
VPPHKAPRAPSPCAPQVAAACDAWRGLAAAGGPGADEAAAGGSGGSNDGGGAAPAPFWLVSIGGGGARALPLSRWPDESAAAGAGGGAADAGGGGGGEAGAGASRAEAGAPRLLVAMSDPSSLPLVPGWPLRNLLLLAAARWRARRLGVLCVRDGRGRLDAGRSFVVEVELPEVPEGWPAAAASASGGGGEDAGAAEGGEGDAQQAAAAAAAAPGVVGWEANSQGKLAPRWGRARRASPLACARAGRQAPARRPPRPRPSPNTFKNPNPQTPAGAST